MMLEDRIGARIDTDTGEALETVCEQYDLKESQVVRHSLRLGIQTIESEGVGAFLEAASSPPDNAPDEKQ